METIKEVKDYLRNNFEEGVDCPCCGRYVRLYKRKLNSGMALTLIRLVKLRGTAKTHVKKFLLEHKFNNGHDWSRLKDWGLLEKVEDDEDDSDSKTSGKWKVTPAGLKFVAGKLTVKSHIHVYDNKLLGLYGEDITIQDALGKKFNYKELMSTFKTK